MHKNKLKFIKHLSLAMLALCAIFARAIIDNQSAEALKKLDFNKERQIGEPYNAPYFSDIVYIEGGNYFVIDGQNSRILKFNSQNQVVKVIKNDSIKNKNQLNGIDADGNFFVRSSCSNEVYKLNPAGEIIKTISIAGYRQCYTGVKVTDNGEILVTAFVYSGGRAVDSVATFFSEEGVIMDSISANAIGYSGSSFSGSFKVEDKVYLLVKQVNSYNIAEYNLQTNTVENSFPIANGSGSAKSLVFKDGKLYVQNTHSTDNYFVYDTDGNLINTISSSVQLTAGNGFVLTENDDILAVRGNNIYVFSAEGLTSVPIDLSSKDSFTELSSSAVGSDCNIFTLSSDGNSGMVIKEFKQNGKYIRNIDIELGGIEGIDYLSRLYVSKTGDLYIYGENIQSRDGDRIGVLKVNSDGSLSRVFTRGNYDIWLITDMEILENGDLYISGLFGNNDTSDNYTMVKVFKGTEMLTPVYMSKDNEEYFIGHIDSFVVVNSKIYAAGSLQYNNKDTGEWVVKFIWSYDENEETIKTVPTNYQGYSFLSHMKTMRVDNQGNIYARSNPPSVEHEDELYSTVVFDENLDIIDAIKASDIVINGEDAVDFDVDRCGRLYYSYGAGFINVFANSKYSGLDCLCSEKPIDPIDPEIPEVPNTGVEKLRSVRS